MKQFLKLCGNTPLVRVSDRIYAKLETYNPTGSVKDRMVSYVVDRAISKGDIVRDTILCEATSGNTGIALSSIAARLGLKCVIFMPKNMSEERKSMMTVYGAKIVNVDENDFINPERRPRIHFLINSGNGFFEDGSFLLDTNDDYFRINTYKDIFIADVNGDGIVNVVDIVAVVNTILSL